MHSIDKNTIAESDTIPPRSTHVTPSRTLDWSRFLRRKICGMSILLVEDNELNTEIAQTLLEHDGALVTTAANGKEALELFQAKPAGAFDAILMDVMMPEMNGYEATRAIRLCDKPDAADVPIIAMTANAFIEDVARAKESGMNDHLSKPIEIEKLKATLAKYRVR